MRRIQNISDESNQRHTIVFQESEIILSLRFYPRTQIWCLDAEYFDWSAYGIKLSLGVIHIESQNQPFDFIVVDKAGVGIDPFRKNDFSSGRCELYLLGPEDMETIRGTEVPL